MFYVTSISSNGEVLQRASAQYENSIEGGKLPNASSYIDSMAPPNTYWDFTSNTWISLGIPPTNYHKFNYVIKQWVDPRTVETIKAQKWEEIKLARDTESVSPLTTPYGIFDADPKSQKNITDAILYLQILNNSSTINFTLHDNSVVEMDLTKLVNVGLLLGQRTQSLQNKGTTLRNQIDAATTKEQVEAITWSN